MAAFTALLFCFLDVLGNNLRWKTGDFLESSLLSIFFISTEDALKRICSFTDFFVFSVQF